MLLIANVLSLTKDLVLVFLLLWLIKRNKCFRIPAIIIIQQIKLDYRYGDSDDLNDIRWKHNFHYRQMKQKLERTHHNHHVVHAAISQRKEEIESQCHEEEALQDSLNTFSCLRHRFLSISFLQHFGNVYSKLFGF